MSELIPLTVLEKFLFWEDRPAYPWCAFCKFEFEGTLDPNAFQQAATEALSRHVLLRSKIAHRRGRLYWQPVEGAAAPIQWLQERPTRVFPHLRHIDLRNEIGLQLAAIRQGDRTDLVFGGHHACADALGGASYARDVFINYANLTGTSTQHMRLPVLDDAGIKSRGRFGMNWKQLIKQLPMQMVGLAGARQFVGRKPVPLIPHSAESQHELPQGYPHVITAELDPGTTSRLRQRCNRSHSTMNDLLARDLFLAINDWRQKRNGDPSEWMRMMIPMNVRTRHTRDLPATNFVSSVFLDRRGQDFADADKLLRGISDEMRVIKDNHLGMTFLLSLKLLNLIPGRLQQTATAERCTSSCIFSNLDRHFLRLPFPRIGGRLAIGNLILDRAWTIAPLRPYSVASFMSLVYNGRLLLTLHHDGRWVEADAAEELMNDWINRIRESSKIARNVDHD